MTVTNISTVPKKGTGPNEGIYLTSTFRVSSMPKLGPLKATGRLMTSGVDALPDADLVGDLVFLVQDQALLRELENSSLTGVVLGDVRLLPVWDRG